MLSLELYTTEHCSLCEQALDLLLGMPEMAGLALTVVDIVADDELLARYGEKIPVLKANQDELCAPFDRAAVLAWLDGLASSSPQKPV